MKILLCLTFILIGFIGVFAQERTISKAEFDSVTKSAKWAPSEWKGKSFRMLQTSEVSSAGKIPTTSGKVIIEFASPTVSRSISEVRSGSKITKTESIIMGDKTYKRNGDEAWVEGTVEVKPQPKTADTTQTAPAADEFIREFEYKYLGTEKLNNLTANVYAELVTIKPFDPKTNKESVTAYTKKYWFSEEGVKLKQDFVTEFQGLDFPRYTRLTLMWELDPNIKVEAPEIN